MNKAPFRPSVRLKVAPKRDGGRGVKVSHEIYRPGDGGYRTWALGLRPAAVAAPTPVGVAWNRLAAGTT